MFFALIETKFCFKFHCIFIAIADTNASILVFCYYIMNILGIDKIVCINLINRQDKYEKANQLFNELGLKVEFYRPEKHEKSGRIGCFESHVNVITQCYNNNHDKILIFEDDIIITPGFNNSSFHDITNYFENDKQCEYFQLGYSILPHEIGSYFSSKKTHNSRVLNYNGNCTHAYILNRNGMKKILETWEKYCYKENLHLDYYYKIIFANNGACSCPLLFDQNFCINNDNDPSETLYFKILRSLSCVQTKYSFFYFLSIVKLYFTYIVAMGLLVIVFIFLGLKLIAIKKASGKIVRKK